MKKNIKIHMRLILILILICVCIFTMQIFLGCNKSNSKSDSVARISQKDITNFISENLDAYYNVIKEKTGFKCEIESENIRDRNQKYIEFDIDDTTNIKFDKNTSATRIIKQLPPSKKFKYEREIEIVLIGMDDDDDVIISLKGNGSISCDYKANDLENPLPSQKEKDESIDYQIKQNTSTKELEDLTSKAHSIYNVFLEICNEYNESLKNN